MKAFPGPVSHTRPNIVRVLPVCHGKRNEHRAPGVTNAPNSDSPRNAAAKQHLKVVFKTENSKRGIPVAAKLGKGFDGAPDPRILSHFVTLCHTLSHRGGRAAREPLGVFWGVCGHAGSSQRHPRASVVARGPTAGPWLVPGGSVSPSHSQRQTKLTRTLPRLLLRRAVLRSF